MGIRAEDRLALCEEGDDIVAMSGEARPGQRSTFPDVDFIGGSGGSRWGHCRQQQQQD
ncbi:MAG: hypothetical protein WA863_11650 [Methyloceanibacter sp.]